MSDLPNYSAPKTADCCGGPAPKKPVDPVARSVAKPSAFSSPGTTKGWQPAKGTRFRQTIEKAPGRRRKKAPDERYVKFY